MTHIIPALELAVVDALKDADVAADYYKTSPSSTRLDAFMQRLAEVEEIERQLNRAKTRGQQYGEVR